MTRRAGKTHHRDHLFNHSHHEDIELDILCTIDYTTHMAFDAFAIVKWNRIYGQLCDSSITITTTAPTSAHEEKQEM
jgi:hypothetical protein